MDHTLRWQHYIYEFRGQTQLTDGVLVVLVRYYVTLTYETVQVWFETVANAWEFLVPPSDEDPLQL